MRKKTRRGKVIIPANVYPWPHELRVAQILAKAGHVVEFLPTSVVKTADMLVDGVEFEMKSPLSSNANSLEHVLKKALRQSSNIIIDMSRMKRGRNDDLRRFLTNKVRQQPQISKLILITKCDEIIDIKS